MSTQEWDRIVEDYLRRLGEVLRDLPTGHRHQMVEEVRSHIAEGVARLDEPTEADVRTLLERLGSPEEIADASRVVESGRASRSTGRRWLLGGIAAALVAAGLSIGLAVGLGRSTPAERTPPRSTSTTTTAVVVPTVVGKPASNAVAVLSALGLENAEELESSVVAPKGTVVSQGPVAGDKVAPGSTVTLTVSSG